MEIYIAKNNENLGPHSEKQITQMLESGFLNVNDSCSFDGHTWQPISNFLEDEEPSSRGTDLLSHAKGKPPQKKISKPEIKSSVKNIKKQKTKISSLDKKDQIKTKKAGKIKSGLSDNDNISLSTNYYHSKESYFFILKEKSLYPRLRLLINILFIMQIVAGLIIGIHSLFSFENNPWVLASFELFFSVFVIFSAFPIKDASEVFVDIADSVIERNSRKE